MIRQLSYSKVEVFFCLFYNRIVVHGKAEFSRKMTMVSPSICNLLSYIANKQIDDKINLTKRLVNARLSWSENLFRKDLQSHYGCVNAIEFSKEGELLVSAGCRKTGETAQSFHSRRVHQLSAT